MQKKIKIFFAIYILFVLKVIIFKHPFEQLYAIVQTWQRGVVLKGLKRLIYSFQNN